MPGPAGVLHRARFLHGYVGPAPTNFIHPLRVVGGDAGLAEDLLPRLITPQSGNLDLTRVWELS